MEGFNQMARKRESRKGEVDIKVPRDRDGGFRGDSQAV